MTTEPIDLHRMLRAFPVNPGKTHWAGCIYFDAVCAIDALCRELETERAARAAAETRARQLEAIAKDSEPHRWVMVGSEVFRADSFTVIRSYEDGTAHPIGPDGELTDAVPAERVQGFARLEDATREAARWAEVQEREWEDERRRREAKWNEDLEHRSGAGELMGEG